MATTATPTARVRKRNPRAAKKPAKLGIIDSPRCRKQLCSNIGVRLYRKWVSDPLAVPPTVKLMTATEARAKGHTQMTGFYNFETKGIGLIVNEDVPVRDEYKRLESTDVHEHGHHFFNEWPEGEDHITHFLHNVCTDGSNEQRFILEDAYARQKLRAGRWLRLQMYLDDPSKYRGDQEPLYNAAWLTLAAHTVLAVEKRKKGRPTALEQIYRGKLNAADVWPAIEAVIGEPDEVIRDKWLEAFQVMIEAWVVRMHEPQLELIKRFRSLFPEPQSPPPPLIWDFGGHEGEGQPGGPLVPTTEPGGTPKPLPPKDDDEGGDGGDDDAPPPPPPGPAVEIELPTGDDIDDDPEADAQTSDEDSADDVEDEVNALNEPAPRYCPLSPFKDDCGYAERIAPDRPELLTAMGYLTPDELVKDTEVDGGELAGQLLMMKNPSPLELITGSRVDTRIIAVEPDHEDPFLYEEEVLPSSTIGLFMGLLLDTSGSMAIGATGNPLQPYYHSDKKWRAAQRAGAVFSRAAHLSQTAHFVCTSRTLRILSGEGFKIGEGGRRLDPTTYEPFTLDPVRTPNLLAHIKQSVDDGSGDNYQVTMEIVLQMMALRKEPAKALVIVTDGGIGVEKMVEDLGRAEEQNIVTFGMGLDLAEAEQDQMRLIFPEERLVLATSDTFVGLLAQTVAAGMRQAIELAHYNSIYS